MFPWNVKMDFVSSYRFCNYAEKTSPSKRLIRLWSFHQIFISQNKLLNVKLETIKIKKNLIVYFAVDRQLYKQILKNIF